jgi:hypothetical protein
MSNNLAALCQLCDGLARGYAYIGTARYCHGDDQDSPTCYETASRIISRRRNSDARMIPEDELLDLMG